MRLLSLSSWKVPFLHLNSDTETLSLIVLAYAVWVYCAVSSLSWVGNLKEFSVECCLLCKCGFVLSIVYMIF